MGRVPQRVSRARRAVQVRGFSADYAGTWMARVPQTAARARRSVQVGGFSADYAGTWMARVPMTESFDYGKDYH